MDELQKLYDVLVRDGKYTKSFDEFKNRWSSDTDYQNQVFDVVSRDGLYTKDKQSFFQKYSGAAPVFQEKQATVQPQVKKKEQTTELPLAAGLSESQKPVNQNQDLLSADQLKKISSEQIVSRQDAIPSRPQIVTSTPSQALRAAEATKPAAKPSTYESERQRPISRIEAEPVQLKKPVTIAEFNEQIKQKEAQDRLTKQPETPYFTGEFGEILNNIPIIGNVIDDFGRAVATGVSNGDIVMPTGLVMTNGKKASSEQIQKFIQAAKEAQSLQPSDEMKDFSKTYQEGGSTLFSLLKGLARNPTVVPEIMVSSFMSALNPASAAAAGTVIGGAAGYGALATPEFGGVGAVPAAAASLPYAMGAANTVLETSLTFSELLQNELQKRNLDFTEANVRTILEDDKTLNSIRNKSVARGLTIGAVDALTGRVAGKVGANLLEGTSASRIKSALAATGIEMVGGSTGEAAGRVVAGQPMDVAEIGLEGIAEGPSAVVSVASELMQRPVYKVNGEITTEKNVKEIIDTASPEDLSKINIDIKNDKKGYSGQIQDKVLTHQIQQEVKQVNPNLDEESVTQITDLEKQLKGLENNKTQVAKDKATDIKSQIKTIQDNAIQKQTTNEGVLRTEQPEVGLQEVGKGDQVTEVVTEEVKPKEEVKRFEYNGELYDVTKNDVIKVSTGELAPLDIAASVERDGKPVALETVKEEVKIAPIEDKATTDLVDEYISKLNEVKDKSPETFWSVDKPFQDENGNVDREKLLDVAKNGKLIKTDAGFGIVGDDGDIKGVFKYDLESKEKTGDAVIQEAIKQGGIKLDNFALPNLMKVYERNGFKVVSKLPFNEEYAPIGWNKDVNGTPDVVAMVYDPDNQLNIEQKDFTDYDEAIAYRDSYADKVKATSLNAEVESLDKLLRENRLSTPYKEKNKKSAAQIENHRRLAFLAEKSLAKLAPNVKIILHETTDSYDKAVPKPSQGAYLSDTNTIHINLQYADVETIPHEVFHAIFAIKIKTDERAAKVAKEMVESVKKVLDKNSPVYKQIEDLASNYKALFQDEERLAELFGILSVNYEKLPVPAKNAIVKFIEKIAKLFGLDATKLIGRTDNSVINLLNTLSEKVAKGQEIQESDINILGAGGDGTRTSLFKQTNNINDIIKLARANGFSEEAISTILNNRGFSEQEITDALATELGTKTKVEVTEELLPGKDSLMSKVDAMIARQKSKGIDADKIADNVQNLVQKSDVYNNATDVQKESLVREARKALGLKEKPAPSVARVKEGVATEAENAENGFKRFFGSVMPEKKITATEKSLLAKQIKDTATGAKNAKKAFMQINNELTKYIKKLASTGTITAKQAAAALRKLSGVNVFDQVSIDRFVDYMSTTFENAEYAEKISEAMAKLPNARKNARTKIGIADSLTPSLTRMLGINPSLIPSNVFDSYLDIVKMIGQRAEVLNLDEVNYLTKKVNAILDAVNTEVEIVDDLAERFESYDGKVIDEDGKLNYTETIKAMLSDELISDDEAELMKKYKSSIIPAEESIKMTDEELAEEKKDLVEAIQLSDINANDLPTRGERDLANQLSELVKTDALDGLSNTQLKNLFKTIDNINNGYLTHYAQLMVERMTAINKSKSLVSGIKKASLLPISKLYSNLKSLITKKNPVSELIRRIPLINIDQQLGNYKDKTVFNSVFEKAAEAESLYKSSISKIQHKLNDAQEAVAKSFKNDGNKTLMSSFKTMAYMVQLEHDSNIDSKQVNQAADYLKATIKHIDEGKSQFGEKDANMLQEILDKYTNEDGQIDADKLYKSFNSAEKDAIKTIRDINESLTDKAVYTASIIRGDKISPLNNYVHLNVLQENLPTDNIAGVSSMEQYNNSLKPSTKAKSLIERTGKVAPINFDVFASANRGANFVLMDYYLTEPIRTARKTFNEATKSMESEGRIPKQQRDILNAVNNAFEEVVSNILTNNFVETSFAEDVVTAMTKQGYRAILGSTTRFVSELSSNIAYAMNDPKALSTGVKLMPVIMGPDAVDIMNNLNSKQTTRVFHGDTLSGRLVDTSTMNQVSGIKGGKSKSVVANKLQQIYNNSLKKYKNFVELTADALISTPDKMVMRPIWFGSFENEFKNITGVEPDFDKIAQNDEAYMRDNKESLDKARDVADNDSVMAGATENPFMGILKGTVKPNQSGWIRGFNTFNNFMTKFMIFEYVTARTAVNAAIGNGSIPKSKGVALLAGVTSRMIVYTMLSQYLGNGLVGLLSGDDDEGEDEKSFLQKLGQSITSAATGLILGRDYGNATKSIVNFGVEKMNEKYLDFLRNGDYDPYKDAIQYSVIPNDPNKSTFDAGNFVMKLGGPLGPSMQTAALVAKKLSEEPKSKEDAIERSSKEIGTRIPLELLGNAGFIPLYKDVRKVVLADIYKDLKNAKNSTSQKEIDKAELQGYDSKSDMKRYDPALYEQTFGKGSPTYKVDKIIKDLEDKQKDMEQKIKDAAYGYTEKTKTKTKKKK